MKEYFKYLEKYNYWSESDKINAGFERTLYLDKIKTVINNRLIKVLIGQRRTGKSFVMLQIIKYLIDHNNVERKNIFYFNKEQFEFDSIQNATQLSDLFEYYKTKLEISGKIYIFLDEIQDVDDWEKLVASWSQDKKNSYELFITGSNSKMLSSELGTLLSGRYLPYDILPFSYREYIDCNKLEKGKASFLEYLKSGGLPELFNIKDQIAKQHYLSALKDSIILNDIVKKYKIKDIHLLERVFFFVVNNPATLFSFKKIVNYLISAGVKTNYETITNYITYLRNALLIHECERYDIKGKSILTGERKFYLNDLSFKNYLSSKFDMGLSRNLENIVYLHYKREGYQVFVGKIYDLEIDFVLEKDGIKEYVQVAYLLSDESVIEREYRSLKRINDNYKKTVLSMDEISFGDNEGIKHYPVWETL